MNRYYSLARSVDAGERTPQEFVVALYGLDSHWRDVWAAARIYAEDGGRAWTVEQFVAACPAPAAPIAAQAALLSWASKNICAGDAQRATIDAEQTAIV